MDRTPQKHIRIVKQRLLSTLHKQTTIHSNRLDLWRSFAKGFNVGFDPNTDKFYNLNDVKVWADMVFLERFPTPTRTKTESDY